MDDTPPPSCAPRGKSGNGVGWWRRIKGEHGKDLPGLHNITKLGNVLEVPGSYDDSMGVVVDNIMKVGGKPKDVRDVLQGGGAGSTYF